MLIRSSSHASTIHREPIHLHTIFTLPEAMHDPDPVNKAEVAGWRHVTLRARGEESKDTEHVVGVRPG